MKVPPSGPTNAEIMLVGEAPGRQEVEQGRPFVGGSGQLLRRMLLSAGVKFDDCYVTNVCPVRPPNNDIDAFFIKKSDAKKTALDLELDEYKRVQGNKVSYPNDIILDGLTELYEQIASVRPKLIIALGGTALWALTREASIEKWAGSTLTGPGGAILVPTNHPARVMRQMELRNITVHDLRRAIRQLRDPIPAPDYDFKIFPSFTEVTNYINHIEQRALHGVVDLACDIETTQRAFIGCVGFAHSETAAICIPFINEHKSLYWATDDHIEIIFRLRRLFLNPRVNFIGQNFAFDSQYFARDWGVVPKSVDDTMIAHHLCYPGTPRGLDYLSRLYLPYHVYWKDEGKFIDEKRDLSQWFTYNCKDCVATYSVMQRLRKQVEHFNLSKQYAFQMKMWHRLLRRMVLGVRIDQRRRTEMLFSAQEEMMRIDDELRALSEGVLPSNKTPWWRSPQQTMHIFYNLLHYPPQYHTKTKRPTSDDEALLALRERDPLLIPLVDRILGLRSMGVFASTFLNAGLGADGRMRTTYDPTGTESFRLASRGDSFGGGTNLQNIPRLR